MLYVLYYATLYTRSIDVYTLFYAVRTLVGYIWSRRSNYARCRSGLCESMSGVALSWLFAIRRKTVSLNVVRESFLRSAEDSVTRCALGDSGADDEKI